MAAKRVLTEDQFQALFQNIDPILKVSERLSERLQSQAVSFASTKGPIFFELWTMVQNRVRFCFHI
jgi:hypothetical protein